jgi:hypothetical protein
VTAQLAARLYRDVVSPLVLGGALRPGRPIGGAASVALGHASTAVDSDLRSRTDLGRTRLVRRLGAIDRLPEATDDDWTLFAAFHDWLAAASPALPSALSPRAADRLLELVEGTLDHVAAPRDAHAALSRHSFFARLFEIERTDVKVSFWAGSRRYLGTTPPERLVAWPELRRVRTEHEIRPLTSLAEHGARVEASRWLAALTRLLSRSPLTDLAWVERERPPFEWTPATLGLVATHAGKLLAVRAAEERSALAAITALGRATRTLVDRSQWKSVAIATDMLAELVLGLALAATPGEWSRILAEGDRSRDLFVALAFGASGASARADPKLAPDDRHLADARLGPLVRSEEARKLFESL